ncbi:dTDP-4-dehydrorhamnose reductase [Nakamurella silvestris]|nr:dTDP-4-dehydrorhamnose reductase [Nakamurella silvestris]
MSQSPLLLVTGSRGQLGSDLLTLAAASGIDAVGFGSAELDITDAAAVETAVADLAARAASAGRRAVVINAAAYTAVDAAETDTERAYLVNETGPANLARATAAAGAGLLHVSTDYVFPGDGTRPYEPADPTGPKSVYGASKLAGEIAVRAAHPGSYVVRTAWVYGVTGANFVKTMCMLEGSRETVSVVADQTGSPTYSADLAAGLLELAGRSDLPGGVLHATNGGETTWHGFTQAIFTELGADPGRVLTTTTAAFPRPAPRPAYSVLSGRDWAESGLTPLRDWPAALHSALTEHRAAFLPA